MSEVYEALRRSGVVLDGECYEEKEQVPPAWASALEDTHQQQDELSIDQAPVLQSSFPAPARLVALSTNGGLGKEKFTVLSTHLKHMQDKNPLKRVIVTSGAKAEGKSLVATNLAISLARNTKQKVLLLEGDMRQPSLERIVGCGEREGLSDWLQASDPRSNYVTRLDFAPPGVTFGGPSALALDGSGNAFVANFGNSVSELTAASSYSTGFNFAPAGAGFNAAASIALDGSGNVFVANQSGNSVSELVGLAKPAITPIQSCLIFETSHPGQACVP